MAEPVVIRIEVNADTKALDRLVAELAVLQGTASKTGKDLDEMSASAADVDKSSSKLAKTTQGLDDRFKRLSRQQSVLAKTGQNLLKVFSSFSKLLAKAMLINLAAMGVALVSVNAAFAVGQFAVKAWHASLKVAAAGAASMVAVLSALAAGQREYAAATNAFRYRTAEGGLTGGMLEASAQLRSVTSNARMAAFGAEALNGAFAAISKNTRVNSTLNAALTALGDFAVVAADPTKALNAGADFLGQLVAGGGINAEMKKLAAEIGPEFARAVDQASRQGLTSSGSFLQALIAGDLSGEVAGQLDLVNRTLFSTAKRNFQLIKEQFADIGQAFLPDFTVAIEQVGRIIDSMLMRTEFALRQFASGSLVEGLVSATEKVADFSVNLFNKWLPQSEGMFERVGGWLEKLRDWFNETVEALRPLKEGGRILMNTFGPLFEGLVFGFGGGVQELNRTLIDNQDQFLALGDSLARLAEKIGELMGAVYDGLVKALPTITRVVDSMANIVDGIAAIVSGLNGVTFGLTDPFGLGALGFLGMGFAGRGMRGHRGGPSRSHLGEGNRFRDRFATFGGRRSTAMTNMAALAGSVALPMALGAPDGQQGFLTGAAGGALMGAGYGPWGALIGGIGGGLIGGISGMLNQSREAREQAEALAGGLGGTARGSVLELLSSGQVGQARQTFDEFTEVIRTLMTASTSVDRNENPARVERALAQARELLDAGRITAEQYEMLSNRDGVGRYNEHLGQQYEMLMSEVNPAFDRYNTNVEILSRVTAKSESEIERLAETLGVDLTGSVDQVGRMVRDLTGVIIPESISEAKTMGRDRMVDLLDAITLPILERGQLLEAVDQSSIETGEAYRAGILNETMQADFFRAAGAYELATNEDPLVAIRNLNEMLGLGGAMYQEGAQFAGGEAAFAPTQAMLSELTSQVVDTEISSALQVLSTRAADQGLMVDLERVMPRLEQAMSGMSVEQQLRMADRIRQQSQFFNGDEDALEGILRNWGVNGAAAVVEPLNNSAAQLSQSAVSLSGAGTWMRGAAVAVAAAAVALREGTDVPNDTPTSRFGRTLAVHDALSARIAGSRRVTSGVRNWNLGSINSDHVTGRALDLTGQNLGAYATAMNAAGGFAEFHGAPSNRHLHVVPPGGDTMSPIPSLGMAPAGGTVVNANISVSGAGDPDAVAARVIAKISRMQRTARERS